MSNEWYSEGLSFSCTQCGNCCTGPTGFVWFNEKEAAEMAADLGITTLEFRQQYARQVNGWWTLNETEVSPGQFDCIFLRWDENGKSGCAVYKSRPRQCRTWPFWPENLKNKTSWKRAAANCPGMQQGGTFYPVDQIRIIRDSNNNLA